MGTIKEINIKIRAYYFYNDIIDIKTFDSKSLKLDKKSYKDYMKIKFSSDDNLPLNKPL